MIRRKAALEDFEIDFDAADEFSEPSTVESAPSDAAASNEGPDTVAGVDPVAEPEHGTAEAPPEAVGAAASVPEFDAADQPEIARPQPIDLTPAGWTGPDENDPFVDAPDPFAGLRRMSAPPAPPEAPDFPSASGLSAVQEAFGGVEVEAAPFSAPGPAPAPNLAPTLGAAHAPEPLPAVSSSLLDTDAEAFSSGAIAPRIAIHIFTERPDTAEIAERVSADRRMSRATTTVRPGGLSAALGAYGVVPTPPLLIVESQEPPDTLIAGLDRLAEACDPGTKVVVIGKANDIALYRELMNRGVSEYLVAPLGPLQLIHAITTLYSDPDTAFVGRTIAFVGAKGGVGSSTLAHNFAYGLSEHVQAATCIVDYDLPFGTAGLDFNQDPVQGLHDALQNPERVDSTLLDRMAARCSDRLSLFAAPASLDDDWDISAAAYEEVGQKLRGAAPYLVLDLPHLWSAWMRSTLIAADDVVLVASPDLASLRNGKNLLDLLKRGRQNDKPPMLVINQVGLPGRPEIPVKEFSKAMGIEPALVLPFDAKLFGQAANNGQMLFEVNAKAKASEGLLQFVQQVSRRELVAPKPKGILERLTGRG